MKNIFLKIIPFALLFIVLNVLFLNYNKPLITKNLDNLFSLRQIYYWFYIIGIILLYYSMFPKQNIKEYRLGKINDLPNHKQNFFLTSKIVCSLHKPIGHIYKTRRVFVWKLDDKWQAVLVDIQKYRTLKKSTIIQLLEISSVSMVVKKTVRKK